MEVKIVTHSGVFHGDEVMATAIILSVFKISEANIVRTREQNIIKEAQECQDTFVLDVGGRYDPTMNNYDHHQKGGSGLELFYRSHETPLATAGLVWHKLGDRLVETKELFLKVDKQLIATIDARDNGVKVESPISAIISGYNLTWEEPSSQEKEKAAFMSAVRVAKETLDNTIRRIRGEENAVEIWNSRETICDGRIVILPRFAPWQKCAVNSAVEVVIFLDKSGKWTAQCSPKSFESFETKTLFPKDWAGLQGEEIKIASGISDAIFCHKGRFICSAMSKESAVQMALKALE